MKNRVNELENPVNELMEKPVGELMENPLNELMENPVDDLMEKVSNVTEMTLWISSKNRNTPSQNSYERATYDEAIMELHVALTLNLTLLSVQKYNKLTHCWE